MKNKRQILYAILILLLPFPVWMKLGWLLTPKKPIAIAIIDKTVMNPRGKKHEPFNWILTNGCYSKRNRDFYSVESDYYGFFPMQNKRFAVKGLEQFNPDEIDSIAGTLDAAYVTDTYGVYASEWYSQEAQTERSNLLYGGLSMVDMALLRRLKEQKKLIITEFNTIASPTGGSVRREFESTFGLSWSGWTGKYYESLDTAVNHDLPQWMIHDYKSQHKGSWPFVKSGIVFVHNDSRIEILENKTHLEQEVPYVVTGEENQKKYGLPEKIKYPYWFDVMFIQKSNTPLSVYSLYTTAAGDSVLQSMGIPRHFPAVIAHTEGYSFYYLAGDYCDAPVEQFTAGYKGIQKFRWFFYNEKETVERASFFWKFYEPLVSKILQDYYPQVRR